MADTGQTVTIYAGNPHRFDFAITDTENGGSAYDLTGLTIQMTISSFADSVYSTAVTVQKNATIDDAANGSCYVDLLSSDTDNSMAASTDDPNSRVWYWELEATAGSGAPIVLATGTLTIRANVENT